MQRDALGAGGAEGEGATQRSAGTSVTSAVGLTLLSTTCCALPVALVALGAGGAVASMASALPWLVALSNYKLATFGFTTAALGYSWWQVRQRAAADRCSIEDAKRLRRQSRLLRTATAVLALSIFAAYGLLPLTIWLDTR